MRRATRLSVLIVGACVLGTVLPAYTTTIYTPERWNDEKEMTRCNNCYNYATDHPNGSFAQPGMAGGNPAGTPFTCGDLRAAAEADGLTFAGMDQDQAQCDPGCCLVALVSSGEDFHWYRRDGDGYWSHKRGQSKTLILDAAGNLILDPQTANRDYLSGRSYDSFCGYFCVCRDQIKPLEGAKTSKPIPPDWNNYCPLNACHETPPNLNFPGCIPPGAPSFSPCVCCSCVLVITGIPGECR